MLGHAGYQWVVVVFFVFIFAANIFLRTAASIAGIVMCRRNDESAPAHADGKSFRATPGMLFMAPVACFCFLRPCKAATLECCVVWLQLGLQELMHIWQSHIMVCDLLPGDEPLRRIPLPSARRLAADLSVAAPAVRDMIVRVW